MRRQRNWRRPMTRDIKAAIAALYAHRRAETRPLKRPDVTTFSACECGRLSRTGMCSDCLSRAIKRLERRLLEA